MESPAPPPADPHSATPHSTSLPDTAYDGERSDVPSPTPGRLLAALPFGLTALFFAFLAFPPVRESPTLFRTFVGVGAALVLWQVILLLGGRRWHRPLRVELVPPTKSHYVQACVQFGVYAYWGWYWPEIYRHAPLIAAQLVFLILVGALIAWSRGHSWRPGFGAFPIVFSTNLFMWFRDDWFLLQFLMVATGALGKEFITWQRDGKRTHIFNPSALGLTVFSLGLIFTGTTRDLTWARELATTIDQPPHIFLVIFLLGLVVLFNFAVTLMTLSAAAVLYGLNLAYTEATGVYQFVSVNISAAVFLGLHLLMTDPATSPRSLVGRVIFGGLYGVGIFVFHELLRHFDAPVLYSKLLVVPLLNLGVPLIDWVVRLRPISGLNGRWERVLPRKQLNLIHMGCWAALFFTMLGTGFVEAPHPGSSLGFWKQAAAEERRHAGDSLVVVALNQAAAGSAEANNELGIICMEGKFANQNSARAARYFEQAMDGGSADAAKNIVLQYLFLQERRSDDQVTRAFDQLQFGCTDEDQLSCFLLGYAHEIGRGTPVDQRLAVQHYQRAGPGNLHACKGLARIALARGRPRRVLEAAAQTLEAACEAGDAECCWYLAYLQDEAPAGGPSRYESARTFIEKACALKLEQACAVLASPAIPPYAAPKVSPPEWSSSVPVRRD